MPLAEEFLETMKSNDLRWSSLDAKAESVDAAEEEPSTTAAAGGSAAASSTSQGLCTVRFHSENLSILRIIVKK